MGDVKVFLSGPLAGIRSKDDELSMQVLACLR